MLRVNTITSPIHQSILQVLHDKHLLVNAFVCEQPVCPLWIRLSAGGIESTKTQTIRWWLQPIQRRREAQKFLGLVMPYRSLIPGFTSIAEPLTDLLKNGNNLLGHRVRGQPLQASLDT